MNCYVLLLLYPRNPMIAMFMFKSKCNGLRDVVKVLVQLLYIVDDTKILSKAGSIKWGVNKKWISFGENS